MPERIQRKRVKGWRMPANTVSVTRPGKWGNPYRVGDPVFNPVTRRREGLSAVEAVEKFRRMECTPARSAEIARELRGKNLACFCSLNQPCHADVLLEIANSDHWGGQ